MRTKTGTLPDWKGIDGTSISNIKYHTHTPEGVPVREAGLKCEARCTNGGPTTRFVSIELRISPGPYLIDKVPKRP